MKHFFVFDLDGTLINTLPGIQHALNASLKELGYLKHDYSLEDVRSFIGGGSRRLFELATKGKMTKEQFSHFLSNYEKYQYISEPYEGVIETLKELNKKEVPILLYSNKPHELMIKLIKNKMSEINFLELQGNDFIHPPKPDATYLLELLKKHGLNSSDGYYVGDSKFDVLTSRNAQMKSVIVTYGYGGKDFINDEKYKSDYYIDSFKEVLKLL